MFWISNLKGKARIHNDENGNNSARTGQRQIFLSSARSDGRTYRLTQSAKGD